jgi:hypothetical protein
MSNFRRVSTVTTRRFVVCDRARRGVLYFRQTILAKPVPSNRSVKNESRDGTPGAREMQSGMVAATRILEGEGTRFRAAKRENGRAD